jgi:uncharacterized membrane protein YdbT with pleckstrin-like domain
LYDSRSPVKNVKAKATGNADASLPAVWRRRHGQGSKMSYAERSLVPGEALLYETRHHWMVVIGPLLMTIVFVALAAGLFVEAMEAKNGKGMVAGASAEAVHGMDFVAIALVAAAIGTLVYGVTKRNATEMAVTDRRVLIKTGIGSRRTLDLMLSRVESIGVHETFFGRMLGYGSVVVHGTGGTPESFVMIAHPQEFRRSVQQQIGGPKPT